jgi:hypothetical protein
VRLLGERRFEEVRTAFSEHGDDLALDAPEHPG